MHRWAVSHSEMSAAVKLPSEHNLAALLMSVGLHGALLLLPFVAALRGHAPPRHETLPNSIAMVGNSIEVEAPTPEVAATPAVPSPESVDVHALPTEADPQPEPAPVRRAA